MSGTSATAGGLGRTMEDSPRSTSGNFPGRHNFEYKEPVSDDYESELQSRLCETFVETRQVPLPLKTPARKVQTSDNVSQGVRKRSSPNSSLCHEVDDAKKRHVSKFLFDSPLENTSRGVPKCLFGAPTDEQNAFVTREVEVRLQHEYHNFCHRWGFPEENC